MGDVGLMGEPSASIQATYASSVRRL